MKTETKTRAATRSQLDALVEWDALSPIEKEVQKRMGYDRESYMRERAFDLENGIK